MRPNLVFPTLSCYVHGPGGQSIGLICPTVGSAHGYQRPPDPDNESLKEQWKGSSDSTVLLEHVATELPAVQKILASIPEGLLLFFWTSKASFRVEEFHGVPIILSMMPVDPIQPRRWRHRKSEVIDGEEYFFVGELSGNTMGDAKWNSTLKGSQGARSMYDFIVVGERSPSVPGVGYYLIVMMVGYEYDAFDGQISMRMGTGTIAEDVWLDNNPTWSLIALA